MRNSCIILLLTSLVISSSVLGDENSWKVRFGLYSSDSTFKDNWNDAGVDTNATDGPDYLDSEKFYPPTSPYAILFFPHSEPTEPDYWPPPNDRDYAKDYRAPLDDSTKIWHMKFLLTYSGTRELTVFWTGMENMPVEYLPLLISPSKDSINLYTSTELTRNFPHGSQRWKFSVEPGYYTKASVHPSSDTLYIGEYREFKIFLYHGSDSISPRGATWEYHGSGGCFVEDGLFYATGPPGGGSIVVSIGNFRDSAEVTIKPGGQIFDIPISKGWNLISLPAVPRSGRVVDIFPRGTDYSYTYDPDSGKYLLTESLEFGKGYFYLSFVDKNYSFVGTPLDSLKTNINKGWNLLGGPGACPFPSNFFTSPLGILLYNPYIWNGGYEFTDSVGSAEGFWIFSGADGKITITTD